MNREDIISRETFELIFETNPDAIMISRLNDGYIVRINEGFTKLTGYSIDETVGKTSADIKLWKDPGHRSRILTVINEKGVVENEEVEYQRKDGTAFIGLSSGRKFNIHETPHIFSVVRDITKRKIAEEKLRMLEEKYRNLVWAMQVGVLIQGPHSEILLSNPKALELLGISEEQLLGKTSFDPDWNVIHEDGTPFPGPTHPVPQSIATRKPVRNIIMGVFRPVSKDSVWLLVDAEPQLNPDGTIQQVVCTFIDISKRKKAENEIQILNNTLEKRVADRTHELELKNLELAFKNKELAFKNKELEQFTYIASHDLQEPLHTLTNFTKLVQQEYSGKMDKEGLQYIEFIYHSTERMRDLIKGLMDYSLLGKESARKTVDCSGIVTDVLTDLTNLIQENKALITVEELPCINGYETEIKLLFQNLIINAIKFRRREISPEIKIFTKSDDKEWTFSIEDNGIGIREQDKEKIFIIFKRLHNRNEFGGTGIGLSHCKKIVELHGGRIWVDSNISGGSTFKFTIPM